MFITEKLRNIKIFKQNPNNAHLCPICNKKFIVGIEYDVKNKLQHEGKFPYPHIHLHGNPLHAMLCYVDSELKIRGITGIESIEITRDSDTLSQIMKKWSNPY